MPTAVIPFDVVSDVIRERMPEAFSRMKAALLARWPMLICMVEESAKPQPRPTTATWYLSILWSSDSDEVAATITAIDDRGTFSINADVCYGAELVWESNMRMTDADELNIDTLNGFLERYIAAAPDPLMASAARLRDQEMARGPL